MKSAAIGVLMAVALSAGAAEFERDIAPLIGKRCLECHNPAAHKGDLVLATREGFRKVGGAEVLKKVSAGEMPPEQKGRSMKLPDAEIALLNAWIEADAPWPEGRVLDQYERTSDVRGGRDWWALQPVVRPALPETAAHPVDAFILARLETAGLQPAPSADRRTLARRVWFDLTGLPPPPAELDAFLNDDSPDAYEKLIDRLLGSPHYGERWARHWLDTVRFAETDGYERDNLKKNIWKYRDWVIDAFNRDMPYTQFVRDQLAGDEVPYRDEPSVTATGMLRAGTWNDEPNDPADYLYERLEDMVHTTTSAFLGLTVKCARCHDHKFDPILQTDYYRIAGFFRAGFIGQGNQGGPSEKELGYPVYGWTDTGPAPPPFHLLVKGERHKPGPVVEPGFLSAVPELDEPLRPPPEGSKTTTRRLQFAEWITHARNPLAARVFVNRLWQHHFGEGLVRTPNNFGFMSDPPTHPELLDWLAAEFMHPGDGGEAWTIKRMHKLILMSGTYRMASLHPEETACRERDAANRTWWKFNRRRLDAEAMRDAMLAVSGELNPKRGGPSFFPRMSAEATEGLSRKAGAWRESSRDERMRRSVYMMTKRSRLLPLMTVFDFTETTSTCGRRNVTTVAPQALALLNNHFVHARSAGMARRLMAEEGGAMERIGRAWHLCFGREPARGEREAALAHLRDQEAHFARRSEAPEGASPAEISRDGLKLWLRADRDVETGEDGRVGRWGPFQARAEQRPILVKDAIAGKAALRFDGKRRFLETAGRVVASTEFTLIAVATDEAVHQGHREILSNWNRAGRSTSSVFLGTTGESTVRFSDAFAQAGDVSNRRKPFVLCAVNGPQAAAVYQNDQLLKQGGRLGGRMLDGPWFIGTQGNYGTEDWKGDIAEILVYDRAISEAERLAVWRQLADRYGLERIEKAPVDAALLALASLCHVLLNANEFITVD